MRVSPKASSPIASRASAVFLLVFLEAALVVCWSAGFVGVRYASDHAPIFLILFWRSLVSGLLLLPFALAIGPRLRWREVRGQILFGALAMSAYLGAFSLAIDRGVPTGLVALITDMLPLIVALLSWPILGQALTARQWIGSAVGIAGVLVASASTLDIGAVSSWIYALPVLGTLSLALATLLQKRGPAVSMPMHQALCIQCLAAAAVFAAFAGHEGSLAPVLEPGFVGGILWLVVLATFGGWGLYDLALRRSSPTRVTAVLYLSPPVVTIWAWLMFDEPLTWTMAAGLLVSLLGIVIVAKGGEAGPAERDRRAVVERA